MNEFNNKLNYVYNYLKSGKKISDRTLFFDGTKIKIFLISYKDCIYKYARRGNKKAQFVSMYIRDKKFFFFKSKLLETYSYIKGHNKYPSIYENVLFNDGTNMGIWLQNHLDEIKNLALDNDDEAIFIMDSYYKKDIVSEDDLKLEKQVLEMIDNLKIKNKNILSKLEEIYKLESEFECNNKELERLLERINNRKLKMKLNRKRMRIAIISNDELLKKVIQKFDKIFVKKNN